MDQRKLRPFQNQALEALRKNGHLICVAATGSGKSLIYERFFLEKPCRMVLISPLIALARQQAEKLRALSIPTFLSMGGDRETPDKEVGVWILSPEKIFHSSSSRILNKLREWKPEVLVVDECHCIWDWGKEFRPAFQKVLSLVKEFQIPRSLWLTATLPLEARLQILENLPSSTVQMGNFTLPSNLHFHALQVPLKNRVEALGRILQKKETPGILFAYTRKMVQRVANLMELFSQPYIIYHAGLSREERLNVEALVRDHKVKLIISTSAFGMGMDYPQLKWALLWQTPPSRLALTQAIGRVGRAGSAGEAILFWDWDDFILSEWSFLHCSIKREEALKTFTLLNQEGCQQSRFLKSFQGEGSSNALENCGRCSDCEPNAHEYLSDLVSIRVPRPQRSTPVPKQPQQCNNLE